MSRSERDTPFDELPGAGLMKKRTRKPASASRGASSRSGTPARTGATANGRPPKIRPEGPFDYVVESIQSMSHEEVRQSLIDAGIIDASTGQLASKYRRGVKG